MKTNKKQVAFKSPVIIPKIRDDPVVTVTTQTQTNRHTRIYYGGEGARNVLSSGGNRRRRRLIFPHDGYVPATTAAAATAGFVCKHTHSYQLT